MLRVLEEIGWRSISAETDGDFAAGSSHADRDGPGVAWLCPDKGVASTHALTSADRSNMAGIESLLPRLSAVGRSDITIT